MPQFHVFANPVERARAAYPYVVVLQADVAETARERVVAPVAPRAAMPESPGRLLPDVTIRAERFVLLVPSLTAIPASRLHRPVASLAEAREAILAAVDRLFFGV